MVGVTIPFRYKSTFTFNIAKQFKEAHTLTCDTRKFFIKDRLD